MTRERNGIMLAHPAESKRITNLGSLFYVQPKLNGVRCVWTGQKLLSSTGREFQFLQHIEDQCKEYGHTPLDGELYVHGQDWEWINSRASRTVNPHEDVSSLQYHIFDIAVPHTPMEDRAGYLGIIKHYIRKFELNHLRIVDTYLSSQDDWPHFLDAFESQGYEGIMFREKVANYEWKRSKGLLKMKPTETDIYKIAGTTQGTGWCYDRLGSFEVQDMHGNFFSVGTGLTAGDRLRYWDERHYLPGKYLLVKHEKIKTITGLPKCTVAVKVLTESELEEFRAKKHNDLR